MIPLKRVLRLAAAGQLDAGFASLATFALQIFAVRVYTVEQLGAFGLVFSTFILAAQIPNQIVLSPLEVFSLSAREADRVGLFRTSLARGLLAAIPAGAMVSLGLLPVVGDLSSEFLIALGASASLAAVVSPLQDHVRRVLHLSGRSGHAAAVSATQLVTAGAALIVIAQVNQAAAPFGALVVANIVSSTVGVVVSGVRSSPRIERVSGRKTWSVGRWLLVDSVSIGLLNYSSLAVIATIAGPAVMGSIEGARVIARPIQVASQGLVAIVSPRSMAAGRESDRRSARSWRRKFFQLLVVPVSLYAMVLAFETPRSVMAELLPNSFVVPNLALATVGAVTFGAFAQPFIAELSGALRQSRLAFWSTIAGTVQLVMSAVYVGIGAFVFPLAVATSGVVRALGLFSAAERIYKTGVENPQNSIMMSSNEWGRGASKGSVVEDKRAQTRAVTRLSRTLFGEVKARPWLYRTARNGSFMLRRTRAKLRSIGAPRLDVAGDTAISDWLQDPPIGVVEARLAVPAESRTEGDRVVSTVDSSTGPSHTGGPWLAAELAGAVLFDEETLLTSSRRSVTGVQGPRREPARVVPDRWRPNVGRLSGRSLILACRDGRGYYHWLYDVLPRLELVERAGWSLDEFDHVVVNGYYAGYQVATLERFGIEADRVVSILKHDELKFETAVVTSHPRDSGEIPMWVVEFLCERFSADVPAPEAKRIYVSRSRTDHGRPAGESELEVQLRRLGFEIPVLEELSLDQKARMFRGADVVMGATGAGLGHVAFCRPGALVIELDIRGEPAVELPGQCQTMGLGYVRIAPDVDGRIPIEAVEASLASFDRIDSESDV